MRRHIGFAALAGLAVLATAAFTSTAQAQCNSGYSGGGYYAPPVRYVYQQPSYCPPTVYYSQPAYRSYSVNVGIGRHRDGIRRFGHSDYSHRRSDRYNDRRCR